MNGEEQQMTILMLPDDLVRDCLARVSRLYYPTLSLVSRRFRFLVASTELYQTRTLLNRTESCLYVCLRVFNGSSLLRWFTLCRGPSNSKKFLVPISSPNFPTTVHYFDAAMVGPSIYTIGGIVNRNASSRVIVMDCRSHTWREAPPMQVARLFQSACVHDGKIYVTGGCENLDLTNWMEVFDTKAQTWEFLQIPSEEIFGGSKFHCLEYEGTVYVKSEAKDVTYKLHKGRWRTADLAMNRGWGLPSSSYSVIENVFYRSDRKKVEWYDSKDRLWRILKGLEKLPSLTRLAPIKLVNYGGKMAVFWEQREYDLRDHVEIWCAEIAIEKRQKREIWGMLECVDIVLSTTNERYGLERYGLEHVLATTI